jgi:hypothetical protein
MNKLLRQLDSQWYSHHRDSLGGLPLNRLWGLAVHERDKTLRGTVSDFELFSLVGETLLYCVPRFRPSCPAAAGPSGRRSLADRFVYFFRFKFVRTLAKFARRLRGDHGRAGDDRYRGPRGRDYFSARAAVTPGLVRQAMDQLTEQEQALITLRYWQAATYQDIARKLHLASRFQAKREHDRILVRLRHVLAEVSWAA